MSTLTIAVEHIGVLPSQANGTASNMDHGDAILDVAASCIRALDYSAPPFTHDSSLKDASVQELHTWDLGEALDDVMKYLDVGLATAEVRSTLYRRCLPRTQLSYSTSILPMRPT